jgi:DNA repair exonuclease SbcCD ATPase subunit
MTMMLDERKANGHAEPVTRAWDDRFAQIERRLAEITESGEQRVLILRDAIADFAIAQLEKRDDEIVSLKKQLADLQRLEQEAAIDQRVNEISARLEEKQALRDRGKNGITNGDFIKTMGMMITQERQSARTEFKAAVEEIQGAVEMKLSAYKIASRRCRADCRLQRFGARRASPMKVSLFATMAQPGRHAGTRRRFLAA